MHQWKKNPLHLFVIYTQLHDSKNQLSRLSKTKLWNLSDRWMEMSCTISSHNLWEGDPNNWVNPLLKNLKVRATCRTTTVTVNVIFSVLNKPCSSKAILNSV